MKCINCGYRTAVVNSRTKPDGKVVWRRRRCPQCDTLFTTEEYTLTEGPRVITSAGHEDFDLYRLAYSVTLSLIAVKHTSAPQHGYWLARTIMGSLTRDTVTTDEIVAATKRVLEHFNSRAAIHYGARYEQAATRKVRKIKRA